MQRFADTYQMAFFDIESVLFTVWGYPVSFLEFFGWLTGVIAVGLSAKANIWSWPVGIMNVVLSFFLFYQVQLYPDMFLQVFFFVTNLLGWWRWANPRPGEEDKKKELRISYMKPTELALVFGGGLLGTWLMGQSASNLHEWLPSVFSQPSASPYLDSFITVMSIITTFYMIQKKVECWIIWILVDLVATYLYFVRDIKFYSLLYLLFTGIATFALFNWMKEYRGYKNQAA
ncbi:MAG: nicotinamide riboside transporter PnuC [Bacteroidota bacterium]